MRKLFTRMVSEKLTAIVDLKITSIVLDVEQPLILKLCWKRGPQTDVT